MNLDPALLPDKSRFDQRHSEPLRYPLCNSGIIGMRLFVAPAIEPDMRDRKLAGSVANKGRSGIAAPKVVGRDVPKLDLAGQQGACARRIGVRHQHRDGLMANDRVGDPCDGTLYAP